MQVDRRQALKAAAGAVLGAVVPISVPENNSGLPKPVKPLYVRWKNYTASYGPPYRDPKNGRFCTYDIYKLAVAEHMRQVMSKTKPKRPASTT